MNAPFKDIDHRDFSNLAKLIEERGLDISCPHCNANSVRALGWLRDRAEMDCGDCHELIVLDGTDLRDTIRNTARQLRDMGEQLHARIATWK